MSTLDRRNFCSLIAAVSGNAAGSGSGYTPFGYLDYPWGTPGISRLAE